MRTIKFYERKGILHLAPAAPSRLIQIYNENAISQGGRKISFRASLFYSNDGKREGKHHLLIFCRSKPEKRRNFRYVISIFAIKLLLHTQDIISELKQRASRQIAGVEGKYVFVWLMEIYNCLFLLMKERKFTCDSPK